MRFIILRVIIGVFAGLLTAIIIADPRGIYVSILVCLLVIVWLPNPTKGPKRPFEERMKHKAQKYEKIGKRFEWLSQNPDSPEANHLKRIIRLTVALGVTVHLFCVYSLHLTTPVSLISGIVAAVILYKIAAFTAKKQ